mgnify:FL=1
MKKFLSLVLALVMTMSLVTVSAGAKDFTDNSKINYEEAVEVMSTLGVVGGYTDGTFKPQGTLTRGAAAKIICNLILGTTTADALTADAAPYKDVATTNVFAPYIAYCAKEGIISGYADGTFRPANTLTGYAFMKMLLGALGLQADKEGYTGPNWSISVAKRALSKDVALDDGLKGEFNGAKAATREEACLYALNMMKAGTFSYPNDNTVIVGNVSVSTSAKAVQDKNKPYYETVFKNLFAHSTSDAFGRPATRWDYKGVKIGTYAKTPDLTYVGSQKINDIYADLNMSTKDTTANLYVNGESFDTAENGKDAATFTVSKANDTKLDKLGGTADKIGNGTLIEVYRNDDNNHVDVIAMSVYAGKITDVKDATSKKDAYVVVDTDSTIADFNDEYETEAFAEDDVVAFTYADGEIQTMYKMESVSGELTKKVIEKSLTIGDTTYKYGKEYTFNGTSEAGLSNKSSYDVYVDANGFALYIEETGANVSDYALLLNINGDATNWINGNRAKLVFADGSVKTVDTDKDYSGAYNAKALPLLVRVKTNSDGEYKLSGSYESNGVPALENKKLTADGKTVNTDSKTIFVINKNGETAKFNVYTGIKNAPEIVNAANTAETYVYSKGGVAKVVYITGVATTNSSKDITFIAGKSASKLNAATDTAAYYVYNAVVKGEVTSVMIMAKADENGNVQSDAQINNPGDLDNVIWFSTTADSDDIIYKASTTSTKGVDVYSADGVKKVSADEVIVGTMVNGVKGDGANMSMASDVKVYTINDDGDIEAIDASAIKTNSEASVIYTVEDGEITNLFIQLPKD